MRGHVVSFGTTAILLFSPETGGSASIPVTMSYDPADPLAVTLKFRDNMGNAEWVFSRELLRAGLSATSPEGTGDVATWQDPSVGTISYALRVSSPFGTAEFRMSKIDVGAFLARTYDSIPEGTEVLSGLDDESIAMFLETA